MEQDEGRAALRRHAESGEIGGDLGTMIRWFFADRATRTVSPFSTMTMPQYCQIMADSDECRGSRSSVKR